MFETMEMEIEQLLSKVWGKLLSNQMVIWATSWQNQQNDCAPREDSDQASAQSDQVFAMHSMGN